MFGNATKILFSTSNVIFTQTNSMSTITSLLRLQSGKLLSELPPTASGCHNAMSVSLVRNYSLFRRSSAVKDAGKEDEVASKDLVTSSDITSDITPPPAPAIIGRDLNFANECRVPRQAWVENLDTVEERKLGLVDLHPDVFGAFPRTDLIAGNVIWQKKYKYVNYDWMPTRGELRGGGRKPWPQKGLGKARHGSIRSPIWLRGSKAHGPRGPKTYFYMYPFYKRVQGLCATLSAKFAQDDIKIVDSLDIPNDDPQFLQDLIEARKWGISVLFVDDSDIAPKNIALATDTVNHLNLMPLYGLNVYSMLKHETLVLTVAAVNRLEERLLFHLKRNDPITPAMRYRATFT